MNPKNIIKFKALNITLIAAGLFALTAFICDKDVSVSPPPPPVESGFININSSPAGATIFLNGRNTGRKTPDSLAYLDYGSYEITLKKQFFRDTSIFINVKEGVRIDTSIDYYNNPLMYGNLNINSSPDEAQIFLNDSATGYTTPALIYHLLPGEYSIRIKKTGFRDGILNQVAVESNITKTVFSELIDTTIWVDFQVSNSSIPTNVLTSITADQNGVKWIGTVEYGVLKFDGSNFTEYDNSNSPLPGNLINCIAVDPTNRIWIGTNSGLAVFDRSSWTIYTTSNSGLPHNNVKALAYEGNNIVWVGTPAGLAKYDGSWQNYIIGPSITNSVTTITVDQSNKKWLSVTDTGIGIVSFDGSTFTDYPIGEYNYFSKQVLCSSVDPSGNVWFGCSTFLGSGRGISKFNGSEFINIVISNAVLINHIYMSSEGIGWVSTDNGVYKITTSILRSYNTSNSPLKSNDIKGSVKDNEGNLWIATGSAGLAKYKGN